MKNKIPVIIGAIFLSYLAFVAVIMLVYEPSPDDMSWEDRQAYNRGKISELHLGDPLAQVQLAMGHADFSEAKLFDGKKMLVLFYQTQRTVSDGLITRDECTPLLFVDEQLVAWGDDTYQQYLLPK
ncbi:DUF3192 domain-containing protein [Shewanella avicenniae]|uniref:DUF3192 domain-containing protein n=1 Tax=Shewanella avicenniae TaxID=2814294 RepID=A0ABX7QNT0_9GAMM|nr:DUF3192 domain-containing protein [Shewanella avicenniae]QSX32533.1 DUF3192 domain-containing protein [Shewanella avicenniae]